MTQTKTLSSMQEEIEKGCGKGVGMVQRQPLIYLFMCGEKGRLCPSCQKQRELIIKIREMIENVLLERRRQVNRTFENKDERMMAYYCKLCKCWHYPSSAVYYSHKIYASQGVRPRKVVKRGKKSFWDRW